MQLPNAKTPITKCLRLGDFTASMLALFVLNAVLVALSKKLSEARKVLFETQVAYAAAVAGLVQVRVGVRFADYQADEGVRQAVRDAESADGTAGGPIATHLFPGGVTPIVKPVGETQVKEMKNLEGRFNEPLLKRWPAGADVRDKLAALRNSYEAALEARRAGMQKGSDLRSARNLALEDFLDVFAEVAGRVKAEFPRKPKMQNLFFDRIDTKDSVEDEVEEEDDAEAPVEAAPKA
jgi:hypothetical protein